MFFFFYIIGDLVVGWWHNEVWIWIMLGFFLFSAITSTIRFLVYRSPRISPDAGTRYYTTDTIESDYVPGNEQQYSFQSQQPQVSKQNSSYCKYCGIELVGSAQYCSNCGALIEE